MRVWYPEETDDVFRTPCWVARSGGKVAAALQLHLTVEEPDAYLYWLVGGSGSEREVRALVSHVLQYLEAEGRSVLRSHRNPFAPGWQGVADSWQHLLAPLREAPGELATDDWILYSCSSGDFRPCDVSPDYLRDVEPNPAQRQVAVRLRRGDDQVAESELWLPPTTNASLVRAGVADLEWIEVEETHQRKGIGAMMLTATMQEALALGVNTMVLWTEADNVAMQRLAQKSGFTRGPLLHWLTLTLAHAGKRPL